MGEGLCAIVSTPPVGEGLFAIVSTPLVMVANFGSRIDCGVVAVDSSFTGHADVCEASAADAAGTKSAGPTD